MLFSSLLYYHMTERTDGYSIVKMIDAELLLRAPCRAISHVENRARVYVLLAFRLRRMYQEMWCFLSRFCQLIMAWFRVILEKWQRKRVISRRIWKDGFESVLLLQPLTTSALAPSLWHMPEWKLVNSMKAIQPEIQVTKACYGGILSSETKLFFS